MRLRQVYLLKDPITNEVCYVGVSSHPLRRMKIHLSGLDNLYFWHWGSWLRKNDIEPIVECITKLIPSKEAHKIEQVEIKKHWGNGEPLLNLNSIPPEEKTEIVPRIENSKWFTLSYSNKQIQ